MQRWVKLLNHSLNLEHRLTKGQLPLLVCSTDIFMANVLLDFLTWFLLYECLDAWLGLPSLIWQAQDMRSTFKDQLNPVFPDIQFTIEEEADQRLVFFDVLVSRQSGELQTTTSRKATDTSQILHYGSNHTVAKKRSCLLTLFWWVETLE